MLYRTQDVSVFENGRKLPIVEEFYTLQGEGYHTGKPAYFIRLGGCDIGCSWCDTKFSWNPAIHPLVAVDEIAERAVQSGCGAVVVTGGEPLIYPLEYLTGTLQNAGIELYIETSGAYPLSGKWNWLCLSPKKKSPPRREIFPLAHELKVIIQQVEDFSWAEENAALVKSECMLYLQPEWSRYDEILPEIVAYVKKNIRWRISLQAHKFMKIP